MLIKLQIWILCLVGDFTKKVHNWYTKVIFKAVISNNISSKRFGNSMRLLYKLTRNIAGIKSKLEDLRSR